MPIEKPIAYAIDVSTGKITWSLSRERMLVLQANQANEDWYLSQATATLYKSKKRQS